MPRSTKRELAKQLMQILMTSDKVDEKLRASQQLIQLLGPIKQRVAGIKEPDKTAISAANDAADFLGLNSR